MSFSCTKKDESIELENQVFADIFPQMLDSICIDRRLMVPPPFIISEENFSDVKDYEKNKLEYEEEVKRIKNDTLNIVIAIPDSIGQLNFMEISRIKNKFKQKGILLDTLELKPHKFNISVFQNKTKYKLKYASTFPKRDAIWITKYKFNLAGYLFFSRVRFDSKKEFAAITAGYMCGHLCGSGFIIYIRKIKNKWVIDQIEKTWIS
ncbi:hypothetical protein [Flavobacterium undicola]|uniref:hypothetical protein n=1 Tax=Flavobacterium undicola TaxID=1932779 RepID=UPI001376FE99|nr:hypothetical protein [Flavobacterium undicola]MBA0883296.1 hypothetical protein [Flavobacterium undicola]